MRPEDAESRCRRLVFEIRNMQASGVIDLPKLLRLAEGPKERTYTYQSEESIAA